MGKIVKQRLKDNTVIAEIQLSKDEARELRGEMENIMLFTETTANIPARVSLRGKNEATKYFLIPKQLRRSMNTMGSVSCQRIRRKDKEIYVYVVSNDSERQSFVGPE